jgi:hypothetical protein
VPHRLVTHFAGLCLSSLRADAAHPPRFDAVYALLDSIWCKLWARLADRARGFRPRTTGRYPCIANTSTLLSWSEATTLEGSGYHGGVRCSVLLERRGDFACACTERPLIWNEGGRFGISTGVNSLASDLLQSTLPLHNHIRERTVYPGERSVLAQSRTVVGGDGGLLQSDQPGSYQRGHPNEYPRVPSHPRGPPIDTESTSRLTAFTSVAEVLMRASHPFGSSMNETQMSRLAPSLEES